MATMNQWGDGLSEELGDVIYDTLEHKAKEEAKDIAKEGIQETGKAAVKTLDKITDHISPIKTLKDKIREKLSNNPITRFKAAVKRLKDKAKQAVKRAAKEGVQAVGRAALKGLKALGKLAAKNPVVTVLVVIVLLILMSAMDSAEDDGSDDSDDIGLMGSQPTYIDLGNMAEDDIITILMQDCMDQQYNNLGQLNTDKEESAKFIYSIFRSYGFNNASIAGILANMDKESGLDPSAIEGIFSEYGFLGTKKAEALLSISNYTENILFPKYVANGKSINRDGYKTTDSNGRTVYYCGMGLVQWTGGNAQVMMNAAETLSMNWYSMDFQLAYILSDCMYRSDFFSGWVGNQEPDYSFDDSAYNLDDYATQEEYDAAIEEGKEAARDAAVESARQSAIKFAHDYEGNSSSDEERANIAEEWYEIIKDWDDTQVDAEYTESIVTLATELGGIIEFIDIRDTQYRCMNGNVFDNSSLATAAVSLAWPTREQSYNNGTNLYQTVLSTIWPTNYTYKSCDHTVACAVRWSGTDDDYPLENTVTQHRYLETSSKWEYVGPASSLTMEDLQPGDIFILNGHTFMYVSEEIIQAAYTGEAHVGSDSVSGSIGERSPGCDQSTSSIMSRGGEDWENDEGVTRGIYDVYRCIDPDESSTYSSIGSGMTN